MSDELAAETPDTAIRAYLFAIGFTLVLLGGEMMAEKENPRFYTGLALVILGLPVHLSWVFWQRLKPWLGERQIKEAAAIAVSPRWWFIMLFALLGAAILSPLVEQRGFPPAVPNFANDFKLTVISHQKFYNERVVLDGKSFEDCEFTNVTFVYNGTAPIGLKHNNMNGTILFATDNSAVSMTTVILYGIGIVPSTVPFLNLPVGAILQPPVHIQ